MDLTVIGLGNPGDRYRRTRHNAGFRTVEVLAERYDLSFKRPLLRSYLIAQSDLGAGRLFLVKPLTYMNNSGQIFPEVLKRTDAESFLVVCDTLDLPVGQCRLKRSGSAAGQKGLASIIRRLGRQDFPRLFIGIGRPGNREDVVHYVLSSARGKEAVTMENAIAAAADAVLQIQKEGLEKVMNVLNRRSEDG